MENKSESTEPAVIELKPESVQGTSETETKDRTTNNKLPPEYAARMRAHVDSIKNQSTQPK